MALSVSITSMWVFWSLSEASLAPITRRVVGHAELRGEDEADNTVAHRGCRLEGPNELVRRRPRRGWRPLQPSQRLVELIRRKIKPLAVRSAVDDHPVGNDAKELVGLVRQLRGQRSRAVSDDGYPLVPLHGTPTPFSTVGIGASYHGESLATKGSYRRGRTTEPYDPSQSVGGSPSLSGAVTSIGRLLP